MIFTNMFTKQKYFVKCPMMMPCTVFFEIAVKTICFRTKR